MKKHVKISLILMVVAVIVGIGYYQLGGFSPVNLALVDCNDFELTGIEFKGTPQDEKLSKSFMEVEDAKIGAPSAILHTIYYAEPEGKRDTMHVFVGIQKSALTKPMPKMMEKKVACNRAVVAKISAHRFVMPSPLRIKRKITDFAAQNGLVLQEIFVDKLLDDSRVEVWAPLVEG